MEEDLKQQKLLAKIVSCILLQFLCFQIKENRSPKPAKAGTGMIFEQTRYLKSKFADGDTLPILKEDQPNICENQPINEILTNYVQISRNMK